MDRHLVIFAMAAVTAAMCGCSGKQQQSEAVRYVKCDTVKVYANVDATAEFPGKVKAATESGVAFRVAGQIQEIYVKDGDLVKEGSVIAKLDDRDYQTQLSATKAEYESIKADAERAIALYEKHTIAKKDYDKAVYGLQQIEAKLKAHTDALADTRLKAPFTGYVQDVMFKEGETVSAGLPVIRLISSSSPEVEIYIPTSYFIRSGKIVGATCTFDAMKDEVFHLKYVGVTPKANLNQLYTTTFRIIPEGGDVPAPGMSAMVEVQYSGSDSLKTSIPVEALSQTGDESCVWLYEDGEVHSVPVKVSMMTTSGRVVIDEGVSEGDIVVAAGLGMLKDGMKVRPLPNESKTNVGGLL